MISQLLRILGWIFMVVAVLDAAFVLFAFIFSYLTSVPPPPLPTGSIVVEHLSGSTGLFVHSLPLLFPILLFALGRFLSRRNAPHTA